MKWKDYLYALLAGSVGVASYFAAKFIYKWAKGTRWLKAEEKEKLLRDLEEFLREHPREKGKKGQ